MHSLGMWPSGECSAPSVLVLRRWPQSPGASEAGRHHVGGDSKGGPDKAFIVMSREELISPLPCVFFRCAMGCNDPGCRLAHVVRLGAATRPAKSLRDACKRALEEALRVKAQFGSLSGSMSLQDEHRRRLELQNLAASDRYAFNLVLGQLNRPGGPDPWGAFKRQDCSKGDR